MKRNNLVKIILFAILMMINNQILAKELLPLPRFVSIKSNEANARTGPNLKYPISWVYIKKGEPVEIIAEFEQWKKIKDFKGDKSWIHETMLSSKRYVIILGDTNLEIYSNYNAKKTLFMVEPGVRASLIKCREKFCEIKIEDHSGWIKKSKLWGVYDKEKYD